MDTKALGLIEVKGYLGAILAADAAVKAANVTLTHLEKIRGGLTTVQLTGDVGAIEAAVDSGVNALKNTGLLVSYHVIPRMHEETEMLIKLKKSCKVQVIENPSAREEGEKNNEVFNENTNNETVQNEKEIGSKPESFVDREESKLDSYPFSLKENEPVDRSSRLENEHKMIENLHQKKVVELRGIVRSLKIPNIDPYSIKFGRKEELIQMIIDFYRKGSK